MSSLWTRALDALSAWWTGAADRTASAPLPANPTTAPGVRTINARGAALIRAFESCRLAAYRDAAGVWTIGWGSTRGVRAGMIITQAEADARLAEDLAPAEAAVARLVTVSLTDDQFAALVSFVFNVGANTLRESTLLRLLNTGDYEAVPGQLMRFVYARERALVGLTRRRAAEGNLWSGTPG